MSDDLSCSVFFRCNLKTHLFIKSFCDWRRGQSANVVNLFLTVTDIKLPNNRHECYRSLDSNDDTQQQVDHFCKVALGLLDRLYPEKTVTVSPRDPAVVTPGKTPEEDRLARSGRVEEAKRISKNVKHRNLTQLHRVEGNMTAHDVWLAVLTFFQFLKFHNGLDTQTAGPFP